jgi:hypothetical protein
MGSRRRTRNYGLELVMHREVRSTPQRERKGLLQLLRRRRPAERVFWVMDVRTGEWRKV